MEKEKWYIKVWEDGAYEVYCAGCAQNIKGTRELTTRELSQLCGMSSAVCDCCGREEK